MWGFGWSVGSCFYWPCTISMYSGLEGSGFRARGLWQVEGLGFRLLLKPLNPKPFLEEIRRLSRGYPYIRLVQVSYGETRGI